MFLLSVCICVFCRKLEFYQLLSLENENDYKIYLIFLNRDAFWPNGILAETVPCRDKAIRMRTRIAGKTKLLSIMPGK